MPTTDDSRLASAIWALLLGVFAVGSEALVISPLLADIADDLSTGIDGAGLSVSVYGLAVAVTAPLAGTIGDRISRRSTILLGLAIFAVAGVACAVAPSLWVLLAGRGSVGWERASSCPRPTPGSVTRSHTRIGDA